MEAAHALDLKIRNVKAAELDGSPKLPGAVKTLVQANRRADHGCQFSQLLERSAGKRLLEHHELEFIEGAENPDVPHGVSSIGVHKQRNVSESASRRLDDFDIAAGLDFQLH